MIYFIHCLLCGFIFTLLWTHTGLWTATCGRLVGQVHQREAVFFCLQHQWLHRCTDLTGSMDSWPIDTTKKSRKQRRNDDQTTKLVPSTSQLTMYTIIDSMAHSSGSLTNPCDEIALDSCVIMQVVLIEFYSQITIGSSFVFTIICWWHRHRSLIWGQTKCQAICRSRGTAITNIGLGNSSKVFKAFTTIVERGHHGCCSCWPG